MSPTDSPTQLKFKNFKGGDYRADGPDGWQFRVRRAPDGTSWLAEERRVGESAATVWQTLDAAADRAAAEEICAKRDPASRVQSDALKAVAAAVYNRLDAQVTLDNANRQLEDAVRQGFKAGLTAGPMLPLTEQCGITTRNRLYQIRDGHR